MRPTVLLPIMLLAGCAAPPAPPSAVTIASVSRAGGSSSFEFLFGRLAHLELSTEVGGTTVSAMVIGNQQLDLGGLAGLGLERRVLVGIEQRTLDDPNHPVFQGLNFASVRNGLTIAGMLAQAQIRTSVPVVNNVDGKTVTVELDLRFRGTDDPTVTRSRSSLGLGDVTITSATTDVVRGATLAGSMAWPGTTVTFPLPDDQVSATLRSNLAFDRTRTN